MNPLLKFAKEIESARSDRDFQISSAGTFVGAALINYYNLKPKLLTKGKWNDLFQLLIELATDVSTILYKDGKIKVRIGIFKIISLGRLAFRYFKKLKNVVA